MSRVVNELDSIHFSIKKASQLVKELGRQVNLRFLIFKFWVPVLFLFFLGIYWVLVVATSIIIRLQLTGV